MTIDEKLVATVAQAIAAERVRQFGSAAGIEPRDVEFDYARAAILACESAKQKKAEGLTAYAQGVTLLSLAREIGGGTRSYPEAYQRGHTLVGLGLAEYADTLVKGTPYWLRLTDAGRALLSAGGEG